MSLRVQTYINNSSNCLSSMGTKDQNLPEFLKLLMIKSFRTTAMCIRPGYGKHRLATVKSF